MPKTPQHRRRHLARLTTHLAVVGVTAAAVVVLDGGPAAATVNTVKVTSMSTLPSLPLYDDIRFVGANPKLAVTLAKDIGVPVKPFAQIEVWESGTSGAMVWQVGSTNLSRYVADGALTDGKTYQWRARGRDANYSTEPYGDWSAWSTMTADTAAPTQPTVSSTSYPEGQTASLATPGQLTITSATVGKEAAELCHSVDGQLEQCAAGSTLADGRRTLTVTVSPSEGWHSFSARTKDLVGNTSESRDYEFGVAGTNQKVLGPNYETFPTQEITPLPPDPAPVGDPNAPPTVSGKLTVPGGGPAVGYLVRVYPNGDGELSALAEATTSADGSWSVTLTNLTPALAAEAAANDGVLNVDAVAYGTQVGGTRQFAGVASLQAGVAAGGALTQAAARARTAPVLTAPLLPILNETELPAQPTAAEYANSFAEQEIRNPTEASAQDAPLEFHKFLSATTPSRTAVSPYKIGTADYANASVAPADQGSGVRAAAAAGTCSAGQTKSTVVEAPWRWTTVGEAHAAYDTKARATYESVANTDVTVGISYNSGSTWGASGSAHMGNNWGWSVSGGSRGPNWARELDLPAKYERRRFYWCDYGGWRYAYESVSAVKIGVPNGWDISKFGADLRFMDGYYKWAAAPYKFVLQRGFSLGLKTGKTRGFGWTASLFGFGATSTTVYSTGRTQEIEAGNGSYNHDIFTYQCWTCKPRGFYSY